MALPLSSQALQRLTGHTEDMKFATFVAFFLALSVGTSAQAWPPAELPASAPATRKPSYGKEALKRALLSSEGTAQVRAAFDAAIGQAAVFRFKAAVPRISGEWAEEKAMESAVIVPVIGGRMELTRGRLSLSVDAGARPAVLRELAVASGDAAALERVYAARRSTLDAVDGEDSGHILRNFLNAIPRIPDAPDREARVALALGRTVLTVVENGAEDYARGWDGRGARWHLHPPHFGKDGWVVVDVPMDEEGSPAPSQFDRGAAAEFGQNLTLVFQPDGFDAYDLAGGVKTEYRSADWRAHFDAVHAALTARLRP